MSLEQKIWTRWKRDKQSTAKIAKALEMEESEVDRILHRIKNAYREKSTKTGNA